MKISKKLLCLSGAAIGLAGLAWATPNLGLTFTNVFGATDRDIHDHVHVKLAPGNGEDSRWGVAFFTDGPTSFISQDLTVAPQTGTTGWHSHPGVLLVTVASGTISWYDQKCRKTLYKAGDSFTENDRVHVARNESLDPARLLITFIVPKDTNRRIDQPAPACALAAGIT